MSTIKNSSFISVMFQNHLLLINYSSEKASKLSVKKVSGEQKLVNEGQFLMNFSVLQQYIYAGN